MSVKEHVACADWKLLPSGWGEEREQRKMQEVMGRNALRNLFCTKIRGLSRNAQRWE